MMSRPEPAEWSAFEIDINADQRGWMASHATLADRSRLPPCGRTGRLGGLLASVALADPAAADWDPHADGAAPA